RGGNLSLQGVPDVVARFLEGAVHFPGGHAAGGATPSSEAEIASLLKPASRVLAVGAQSSLTGGATPMGDLVISLSRMNRIVEIGRTSVRAQAGVTLVDLDVALRKAGRSYPPVPTFMGATVGGIVATNAAGAATFRHGTTRDWVQAITVVLASGGVLAVERGSTIADNDGSFAIALADRLVRVPVPSYRMPRVPKLSAGYFAAPAMDLVDLFVGSEGTLGIVTEVTLRILETRPAACLAFVPFADSGRALTFAGDLRRVVDVAAIEHMVARCLDLLRADSGESHYGLRLPVDTSIAQ